MKSPSLQKNIPFTYIYQNYFPKFVRFAKEYVLSTEDAENIVQDIFLYLWEHQEVLNNVTHVNAFLFTLIKNKCIDFYRQKNIGNRRTESLDNLFEQELQLKIEALIQFDEHLFLEKEIEELLNKAIGNLPERCREVFILSRMNGLKHEEIANKLHLSVHTVQNHITTAIRKLKVELKDYIPLLIFII